MSPSKARRTSKVAAAGEFPPIFTAPTGIVPVEQKTDLQSEIKRCVEYHSSSQCHVSSSSSASKTNGHPPPTDRSPWRPSQPIPRYIERGDKFLVSRAPPPSLKGVPDWRRTYRQKMGGKDESRASVAAHYVGNEGAAGGYFRPS